MGLYRVQENSLKRDNIECYMGSIRGVLKADARCLDYIAHVAVSENKGTPQYRPPNTTVLLIGTPKRYP